ncbi:MAG: BON domain-containing protein [bacterium]|nr:BON domain-containing protein [bacterium]
MRLSQLVILVLCISGAPTCSTIQSFGTQLDDTGVSARVQALLLQDTNINALDISVATDENEVFLVGRVPNREQRLLAEKHARSVTDVWSVINHLKVGVGSADGEYSDQSLRDSIQKRILRDQNVLGLNVQVLVHEGEAYLLGRVKSENERQQAVSVARETEGVLKVRNYLKAGRARNLDTGATQ